MSGYGDEAATVLGRLDSEWGNRTPVDWPNLPFDPTHEGGDPKAAALAESGPWIRPRLFATDAARREIGRAGSRTFRHHGLLLVQVFTPVDIGDGLARSLAEDLCGIFRAVVADGVVYEGPTGEAPTARDDGPDGRGWYMWTVTVPYTRDSLY